MHHTNIYITIVPNDYVEEMTYIRNKKIQGKIYYYVVEGKLDKQGRVKQRVILYLGNIDNIIRVFSFFKEQA